MQPLPRGDAANANVPAAQNLLTDQRHHDGMINVVVGCVAVCDILKREPTDEADDAGIARLEHSMGPHVHDWKPANEGFDDDLCGVKHGGHLEQAEEKNAHSVEGG